MASRIEDYAMIGDLGSAALVGRDGSIDWLCWPRFDSDACFAALLGTPENGRWLIAPKGRAVRTTRSYRWNTLILETRFETDEGIATNETPAALSSAVRAGLRDARTSFVISRCRPQFVVRLWADSG